MMFDNKYWAKLQAPVIQIKRQGAIIFPSSKSGLPHRMYTRDEIILYSVAELTPLI